VVTRAEIATWMLQHYWLCDW